MSINKDPSRPLMILLLALLNGSALFAVPSDIIGTHHTAILPLRQRDHKVLELKSEDYDEYTDPPSLRPVPTKRTSSQFCDYDRCRENQVPCSQLAASSYCLCPGITGSNEVPVAPEIKRLTTEGSMVFVQWCAPLSDVTHYNVSVGELKPITFENSRRRASVGELRHGVKVCVVAVNDRGFSQRNNFSCKIYEPPGDGSVALKAGLIGGTLGLLLLVSLALLLWRHRAQRQAGATITHGNEETL